MEAPKFVLPDRGPGKPASVALLLALQGWPSLEGSKRGREWYGGWNTHRTWRLRSFSCCSASLALICALAYASCDQARAGLADAASLPRSPGNALRGQGGLGRAEPGGCRGICRGPFNAGKRMDPPRRRPKNTGQLVHLHRYTAFEFKDPAPPLPTQGMPMRACATSTACTISCSRSSSQLLQYGITEPRRSSSRVTAASDKGSTCHRHVGLRIPSPCVQPLGVARSMTASSLPGPVRNVCPPGGRQAAHPTVGRIHVVKIQWITGGENTPSAPPADPAPQRSLPRANLQDQGKGQPDSWGGFHSCILLLPSSAFSLFKQPMRSRSSNTCAKCGKLIFALTCKTRDTREPPAPRSTL